MRTPLILVNFKVYESSVGANAIALAKLHERIAQKTGANIGIAVSALDLAAVSAAVSIPVFAQHVDGKDFGAATGAIIAGQVKAAGAVGTLLNHSEKRLGEALGAAITAAKRAGLVTVVCAENAAEAEKFVAFAPDFLAVEPPELIGGDISVTTANPEIIREAVTKVGQIPLLVGAGVKNGADVAIALELGAVGVLLASGVTRATDPEKVLRDLVSGLSTPACRAGRKD